VCPKCDDESVLKIENEVIQFGMLDGFPAPAFHSKFSVRIPGLEYLVSETSKTLRFEALSKHL
jgi:hypothetical protein